MALTLVDVTRSDLDRIAAEYAEHAGHRIPCQRGLAAYHLSARVADRCCGQGALHVRALLDQFSRLDSVIEMLPLVGRD